MQMIEDQIEADIVMSCFDATTNEFLTAVESNELPSTIAELACRVVEQRLNLEMLRHKERATRDAELARHVETLLPCWKNNSLIRDWKLRLEENGFDGTALWLLNEHMWEVIESGDYPPTS